MFGESCEEQPYHLIPFQLTTAMLPPIQIQWAKLTNVYDACRFCGADLCTGTGRMALSPLYQSWKVQMTEGD